MKKWIITIVILLLAVTLVGCQSAKTPETTDPGVTESPEEAEILKILMIGDSNGNDTMWLTYDVFKAEQPERKVLIGNLYYSSCTMSEHVKHATEDIAAYKYHRNDNGYWDIRENYSIRNTLEEERWDIVLIQETNHLSGIDEYYQNDNIATLTGYIKKVLGYEPIILWNMEFVNPVGFDDWIESLPSDSWINNYQLHYDTSIDKMYECILHCVNTYVLNQDNGVSGVLPTATPIQHALKIQGIHEKELFRDYGHLNDYGRLMVAYSLYAQVVKLIDGEAPELTELKLNTVRVSMRKQKLGDLVLDDAQQKGILDAVNYTLENPMKMPG